MVLYRMLVRFFNSEVSTPKKQHLMIFMRALLTTIIGQCQIKALNTELTIACLYKALMRFMMSHNTPKRTQLVVNDIHSHNDIHGSLKEGYSLGRVRIRLRAQIHFRHTSYSLQILALTRILNKVVIILKE